MKKVVMIPPPFHTVPPLDGAAVETWMHEVAQRIFGLEIHIVSIGDSFLPEREVINGVHYHRIVFSKLYKRVFQKILGWDIFSFNKRVIGILQKIEPDIIHIHNYRNSFEIVEWSKKNLMHSHTICHMHNFFDNMEKIIDRSDTFIACSQYLLDAYGSPKHGRVIYNGVDVEKFANATKKRNFIRKRFTPDKINVCYIGRISPEKGVDKFIDLAEKFKNDCHFRFYLIGNIPTRGERRSYYETLRTRIDRLNLNTVIFLGEIPPAKIHYMYQMADFVVIPSKFEEPFGMVAIEAMASKIPIIAAKKGGMAEYLHNGSNSVLVDDYDNFANVAFGAIYDLLENAERKEEMIENAFQMVQHNFDWYRISEETENTYRKLL